MSLPKLALLLFCLSLPASTWAAGGDPEAGKQKSAACQACHGPDGVSPSPAFPHLAGQYRDYLVQALLDYQSGQRANAIMRGFAEPLSRQDIEDLAAYYASRKNEVLFSK
jgi:cytochrome c553